MRTEHPTSPVRTSLRTTVALVVAIAAALAASASHATPIAPGLELRTACSDARAFGPTPSPQLARTTFAVSRRSWTYGWPVKPFDRQHPVRGFLNDPRNTFHFGIDIAAPDGTPVYAVAAGTVNVRDSEVIEVLTGGSSLFAYWHVVPAVRHGQYVTRHQLIAHIAKGWGHVHLGERDGVIYVNPLRDGGIGPYIDRTPPTVDEIGFDGSALVAAAHDTPDPRVPGAWADEPVTPGLLRWRLVRAAHPTAWQTAFDFRFAQLGPSLYRRVYTRRTRGNHKGQPGQYCFYLARGARPLAGTTVEIEVSDTAGNRAVYTARIGATRSPF